MTTTNQELIDQFFRAYAARDMDALRQVLAEDVRWIFPGRHPLGGVHPGVAGVVAFFDGMGMVMAASGVRNEELVSGSRDDYVIECQHISTTRGDGAELDQDACVLWKFRDGKIVEGRHFVADERALEEFFNRVMVGGDQGPNQTTDPRH
jgi:ketosteroid isomerase-like protein